MRIESFEPIVNENSRTLILGTMPGNASLKVKEYYGHPDNLFWDIIFRVFKPDWRCDKLVTVDYEEKKELVLQNGVAIWDVLKYCDRKGSLDRDIRNQIRNDFNSFFSQYEGIEKVVFNGQIAAKYFEDFRSSSIVNNGRTFLTLQSTSPNNTTNSFFILGQWRQALKN